MRKVWQEAEKFSKPWRRPIITCVNTKCSNPELTDDLYECQITVSFKNIGKYPAEALTMRSWYALEAEPIHLMQAEGETLTNRIQPENPFHTFCCLRYKSGSLPKEKIVVFICLEIRYFDPFNNIWPEPTRLYFRFKHGDSVLYNANVEELNRFLPYLEKFWQESPKLTKPAMNEKTSKGEKDTS
jgi:hypothetical protein